MTTKERAAKGPPTEGTAGAVLEGLPLVPPWVPRAQDVLLAERDLQRARAVHPCVRGIFPDLVGDAREARNLEKVFYSTFHSTANKYRSFQRIMEVPFALTVGVLCVASPVVQQKHSCIPMGSRVAHEMPS